MSELIHEHKSGMKVVINNLFDRSWQLFEFLFKLFIWKAFFVGTMTLILDVKKCEGFFFFNCP